MYFDALKNTLSDRNNVPVLEVPFYITGYVQKDQFYVISIDNSIQ